MDKYEYQVCADQIKALIKDRRFTEAMDIADTIDWRRVKSFSMLCTVSEVYKITRHYSEARDILLLAYERYPDRANVVYALCELAIKLNDMPDAIDYYKEYVRLKPHDTNRYVLLYKIYDAQDVPIEEKISLLEEYKKAEYTEKWAYELALLYHRDGQETKCVETCDEIALWFGEGTYVHKALELKMQHAPLTREQQRKYDGIEDEPISAGAVNVESAQPYEGSMNVATSNGQPVNKFSSRKPYSDILVKPVSTDKYSTINLQEELAKNMEELYARERNNISAPYYGSTSQLYEPSQEEFLNQLNQISQPTVPSTQMSAQADSYYGQGQAGYDAGYAAMQPQYDMYSQQTGPVMQQTGQMQLTAPIANDGMYGEDYRDDRDLVTMDNLPVYDEKPGDSKSIIAQSEPKAPVEPEVPVAPVTPTIEATPGARYNTGNIGSASVKTDATPEVRPEKQITGQIDISDFMKDWEAKKRSGQEQRKSQIRAKSLEHTSELVSQLEDKIPGIGDAVAKSAAQAALRSTAPIIGVAEEILRDDKLGVVTRTTISSPVFDKEPVVKPEQQIVTNSVPASKDTVIPDVLPGASDILASGYRTTLEDEYGGEIAKIRREDEEMVKRLTGELPPLEEPEQEEEEQEVDYGEAEEIEEVVQPEIEEEDEELESDYEEDASAEEITTFIPPLPIDDVEEDEEESEEDVESEEDEELEEEEIDESEEVEDEESIEEEAEEEEPVVYPYEVEDLGEVEDFEDIEQPDEVDDILKTRPLPVDEINEATAEYEADVEEPYTEEEDEEPEPQVESKKKSSRPKYMVMEDAAKSRRDFDDSEIEIFGCYEGIESAKAQIVDVIDDMSMEAGHGNVIVMGSELFGRKSLAIDIVRAMQRLDSSFSGKVAKISGEALNNKNISTTLSKLQNGALVIEQAGGLEPQTMNAITDTLASWNGMIFVVLEDDEEVLEPLLSGCPDTKSVFDARIIIEDFNDDNLVSYAKGYAREEGYSIDEMGVLALHTRIAEMQSLDHKVSVDEVIELVDEAIRHVDRKNMSHFMDVLLAKRYDMDDYIILREKDFLI